MRIHPREASLRKAEFEFSEFINDLHKKHDVTEAELLQIFAGYMARMAKYQIRAERHPNEPDKPGGIE